MACVGAVSMVVRDETVSMVAFAGAARWTVLEL